MPVGASRRSDSADNLAAASLAVAAPKHRRAQQAQHHPAAASGSGSRASSAIGSRTLCWNSQETRQDGTSQKAEPMATRVPDRSSRPSAITMTLVLACAVPLMAQQAASSGRVFTADDYARAERFMGYNTNPLVFHGTVRPNWLGASELLPAAARGAAGADDRFWYRSERPRRRRVHPRGSRARHAGARVRSREAGGGAVHGGKRPLRRADPALQRHRPHRRRPIGGVRRREASVELRSPGHALHVERRCTGAARRLRRRAAAGGQARDTVASPDGTKAAFVRDFNLWVRDVARREGDAADDRRHQGFRLCDQRRRLDAAATRPSSSGRPTRRRSRPSVTTRAASARCTSSTPIVGHPTLHDAEIPAAGRRQDLHDRARGDRRRPEEGHQARTCRSIRIARRCAITSSAAARGPTCSGATTARRWRSSRRRAITSARTCASPTPTTGEVRNVLTRAHRDVLRVGPGPRELALPAAVERGALVLAQGRLGPSLSARRRRPACRRTAITSGDGNVTQVLRVDEAGPDDLLPGRRQGGRPRSRTSATSTRSASTAGIRRC